jgi:precorrin-6B methylase 2
MTACSNGTQRPRLSLNQRTFALGTLHVVADFGCGPGHTAIEIAKWVGPSGHVHAMDINPDFVSRTRKNAKRTA